MIGGSARNTHRTPCLPVANDKAEVDLRHDEIPNISCHLRDRAANRQARAPRSFLTSSSAKSQERCMTLTQFGSPRPPTHCSAIHFQNCRPGPRSANALLQEERCPHACDGPHRSTACPPTSAAAGRPAAESTPDRCEGKHVLRVLQTTDQSRVTAVRFGHRQYLLHSLLQLVRQKLLET